MSELKSVNMYLRDIPDNFRDNIKECEGEKPEYSQRKYRVCLNQTIQIFSL